MVEVQNLNLNNYKGLHMPSSRIRIRSYKAGSKSARALADYLGVKVLKQENSKFIGRRNDIIINWGNSSSIPFACQVLNEPYHVATATNKLKAFEILCNNVNIPRYTTISSEALQSYKRVFVRQTVSGHSGEGILVVDTEDVEFLPPAPLYVEAVAKKNEYRAIVVGGKVVDLKQKRLASDAPEDRSKFIRNLQNGWIFARDNVEYIEGLNEIAIKAVNALGLDFGAVDIITDKNNVLYVLEVNTAFGLEGQTIELVGDALKDLIRSL